ncbi:excinuclease ABC subunit UvrC [Candidatus Babeliales bacterium]|nr:excinuclease ABC subunit UvrC [Candidatus Babeliales bacterium]
MKEKDQLLDQIKRLPQTPGVYFFKDERGDVVYIGKAKNLRSRVSSYVQSGADFRAHAIVESSVSLDFMATETELEAMLLEAKLIQSHKPKHNIMYKSGQPFLYITISSSEMPRLSIVRQKKTKGTYFGPFIEKGPVRRVFDFLMKTFRLKLCGKKIENGCLYYHLGMCAGSCRPDFDKAAYKERVELAKKALTQGHKKFLAYLEQQIKESSANLEFEKSRELHEYHQAFERVFSTLDVKPSRVEVLARKHVWIVSPGNRALFFFVERDGVLNKKRIFYLPLHVEGDALLQVIIEYFASYYRMMPPAATILINFDVSEHERTLMEQFLESWHERDSEISISKPTQEHHAGIVRMALIHVAEELKKHATVGKELKRLLKLPFEPHTIDCFDISHKQGMFLVGSCIRFKDGQPDKDNFRRFKIKTVHQNDDYASLREVVSRRYHDVAELPDLILIDGGKGQLSAVQHLFEQAEFVSLAKREETVFSKRFPQGLVLDQKTHAAQLLIALRDYAHHFAISYHRSLATF